MTTPGRPVWIVTTTFPGLRSMWMSAIAACPTRALRYFRSSSSSLSSCGKVAARVPPRAPLLGDAESKADRIGLLSHSPIAPAWACALAGVFVAPSVPAGACFVGASVPRLAARAAWRCRAIGRRDSARRHDDLDVTRALLNRRRAPHRRRHEPLELRPFVDHRVLDVQRVDIHRLVRPARPCTRRSPPPTASTFSICSRGVLLRELRAGQRLVDALAADLVDHQAHLVRRLARRALECARTSAMAYLPPDCRR